MKGKTGVEKLQLAMDGLIASLSLLLAYALPAGVVRFIYHMRLVRLGHRDILDRAALIEIPIAAFGVWVGAGISAYFGLSETVTFGVVAVTAWFGPVGFQTLLIRRLEKLGVIEKQKE
jgi:hypothetical protein